MTDDKLPESVLDKNVDQAQGIVPIDDYEALPLSGPGRWAHPHPGMTLYTNDANVLFLQDDTDSVQASIIFQAMRKLFESGKSATEAFDILRLDAPVTTGDLSELE